MIDSFYLAARYLLHQRGRSLLVIACLVLVAGLPIALDRILAESERQLTARADATPMLLGSRGSALASSWREINILRGNLPWKLSHCAP